MDPQRQNALLPFFSTKCAVEAHSRPTLGAKFTMLGFPTPGTAEYIAFWAAFWPSFWSSGFSGLITSLLTALLAGVILFKYQKGIEHRSLKQTYARELSLKLDPLRQALGKSDVVNISSFTNAVPAPAHAAAQLLSNAPLTVWKNMIDKESAVVGKMLALQRAHTDYLSLAANADQLLHGKIRSFNHQRGAISANDAVYFKYAVGVMLGLPGEQLLPWLASDGPGSLAPYEAAWTNISSDPALVPLGEMIKSSRGQLKLASTDLLSAIDLTPR